MDCFSVDSCRSLLDIGSSEDLKDLWESDLDPAMQEVLRMQSGDMTIEWSLIPTKDIPGVILHDRLMTDAALGTMRPIKTEHSYSLASDGESLPDSPLSQHKVDDMEDECFPAISMNTASAQIQHDPLSIKEEPSSETDSNHSSSPSSPHSIYVNASDIPIDVEMPTVTQTTIIKPSTTNILLTSPHSIIPQKIHLTKNGTFKLEPQTSLIHHNLPPTPPSCSSSEDSEDNAPISQPSSPAQRKSTMTSAARLLVSNHHHTTTRQPINTPLISSQPKGSTGTLILTEEEKRTLIAEGYPVPTRLPLSKAEEKSLKKIRRKIKNKISAQESRRKKKEYMDQLERKVELLVTENNDYRQKIETLESSNTNLIKQLKALEAIVARTHPQIVKQIKQQSN